MSDRIAPRPNGVRSSFCGDGSGRAPRAARAAALDDSDSSPDMGELLRQIKSRNQPARAGPLSYAELAARAKDRVRREFHAANLEANRAEKVAREKREKADKLKKQLNRMNNRSADYSSDSSSCTKLE